MARQAATDTPYVSVIVLVYNELDSVEPLHRELIGVLDGLGTSFEVLYVDDGSRDGSTEKLGQLATHDRRVRVVSFRRNFGQSAAVQAGIDHSRGAVVVFMDGDLQNDPHDIPNLLQKVEEGYDVVCGWRRNRRGDPLRMISSTIAYWITARVTGVPLSDFGCTLKACRREVVGEVQLHGERHRFIPVYASMLGARITELPVNHRPRTYGASKYSIWRSSRMMLDLIAVKVVGGYSARPTYFFGVAGFGVWIVALVLGVVAIIQRLGPAHVSAHSNPLFYVALALGVIGLQLVVTGLLAELLIESRGGPVYIVREVIERTGHRQSATDGRQTARVR